MRFTTLFVCALLLGAVPSTLRGQDLGEIIEGVGEPYAQLYLEPLANALGADMNAGLFHTASIGGGLLPLIDVYVGAKAMGTLVTDDDETFDLNYTADYVFRASNGERYTVPVEFQITNGPTVFGDTEPGTVTASIHETVDSGPDGEDGTPDDVVIDTTATFNILPGLVDTPVAPIIVPQVGIGSLAGTDLVVRYLPRVGNDDYGTIGLVGVGVRHSLSQYIPLIPVQVSAQVMWQKLSIENDADDEIFVASAWAANVAASKSFILLTVYGGLQVERSTVEVDYTIVPGDPSLASQTVAFDVTGDNTYRALAGVAFGVGPLTVNADAAVGNRTVLSAGLGLSL